MGYGFMDGWGYMGWGGMAFGGLMMLLWVALVIALIVLIVRWLGGTPRQATGGNALETLRQRFARGEIDTAEFDERSRQLRATE
jgi:putative membrane protein